MKCLLNGGVLFKFAKRDSLSTPIERQDWCTILQQIRFALSVNKAGIGGREEGRYQVAPQICRCHFLICCFSGCRLYPWDGHLSGSSEKETRIIMRQLDKLGEGVGEGGTGAFSQAIHHTPACM